MCDPLLNYVPKFMHIWWFKTKQRYLWQQTCLISEFEIGSVYICASYFAQILHM